MRRAAATVVTVLSVVLTAADLGDGASAAGAQPVGSTAHSCAMHRHGKRVVRQVRRHGKLRTVRRTRHWWSCDPAPPQAAPAPSAPSPDPAPAGQSPAPAPAPAPAPVPAPEPEPEPEPSPTRLSVKSVEYAYTLSRLTLTAGEDTIELDNRGQDAHNLNLQLAGGAEAPLEIPETESLQRRTAHFTLQPGTYRLWCSLPTHDEEGMHATLVVEAP